MNKLQIFALTWLAPVTAFACGQSFVDRYPFWETTMFSIALAVLAAVPFWLLQTRSRAKWEENWRDVELDPEIEKQKKKKKPVNPWFAMVVAGAFAYMVAGFLTAPVELGFALAGTMYEAPPFVVGYLVFFGLGCVFASAGAVYLIRLRKVGKLPAAMVALWIVSIAMVGAFIARPPAEKVVKPNEILKHVTF